jgi:hypothetical protein
MVYFSIADTGIQGSKNEYKSITRLSKGISYIFNSFTKQYV